MCREFDGSVGALGVAPPSYPHEAFARALTWEDQLRAQHS